MCEPLPYPTWQACQVGAYLRTYLLEVPEGALYLVEDSNTTNGVILQQVVFAPKQPALPEPKNRKHKRKRE